jgi:cytochrome c oxidase subunit II
MGLVLLIVLCLMAFVSLYFLVAKTWWFQLGASSAAAGLDHQFVNTGIAMGIAFLIAQVGLGIILWKYRDRGASSRARCYRGDSRPEILVIVLAACLFMALDIGVDLLGGHLWAAERFRPAVAGATQVEVNGMQFAWYFRYPGPDGKFGATKPELEDASAGGESAIGVDPGDPASKDDVVSGVMVVPINREVDVILRAHDVIHSFGVPAMRFKQDAVPGLAIHMHFTPTRTGDFEAVCSQLCGLGHYKMHGIVRVVTQEEFDKWLAAREAEKQ